MQLKFSRKLPAILLLSFFALALSAQTMITKNFEFSDGVYLSLESLQKDKPDYKWKELRSNLAANPQTYMTQVEYLAVKESGDTLNMDSVYALCLGGIPFIRLERGTVNKELTTFAGLQSRGRLSYFSYENTETVKMPFSAYNPINGRAFRTKTVEREKVFLYEKVLDFATGEVYDFTRENMLGLVADDPELRLAVEVIKEEELGEKLFKALLIYDDRHPIYLKE